MNMNYTTIPLPPLFMVTLSDLLLFYYTAIVCVPPQIVSALRLSVCLRSKSR